MCIQAVFAGKMKKPDAISHPEREGERRMDVSRAALILSIVSLLIAILNVVGKFLG